MNKVIRMTTMPISLEKLLAGQMRYLKTQGFEVYMVSSWYDKISYLQEKESSLFIALQMTRKITPLRDLLSLIKLIRLFIKLKPQIVHTHTPKAGILGMLASKILNIPIRLHTVAGLPLMETTGIERRLLSVVERITYRCATCIYPNSHNLAQFILDSRLCSKSKLKVLGNGSSNGINTEYFRLTNNIFEEGAKIRKELNINNESFVFIFIGRIVKDKGINELVNSFISLKTSISNICLILVGNYENEFDPIDTETRSFIEKDFSIHHVGFKDDVRPYLALSNALIFPSYREGFPNVPMQAGCFNLPCIVSDINGCNEIIIDGVNGLIVPAKSVKHLKDAMKKIVCNNSLYTTMKENSREMIVKRYDQQYLWSLLNKEYTDYLSSYAN